MAQSQKTGKHVNLYSSPDTYRNKNPWLVVLCVANACCCTVSISKLCHRYIWTNIGSTGCATFTHSNGYEKNACATILFGSEDYEDWLREIEIWQCVTELEKKKQVPAIYLSLQGKARKAWEGIDTKS